MHGHSHCWCCAVHADGTTYVDAPPNPWADMQREEDARDLVLFTQLVEKVGANLTPALRFTIDV